MDIIKSFPPVIDKNSRILVLGSMPGIESLLQNRYYAHSRNDFWRIIYALFDSEPEPDYKCRKEFLLSRNIALWDVIKSCRREGSLDSDIKDEEPNDLKKLLRRYPGIKHILFNGTRAFNSYRRHIGFDTAGGISYKRLPSTSPAHAVRFERKIKEWMIIREILGL